MRFHVIIFLILGIIATSCKNSSVKSIELSEPQIIHLPELSSASGIAINNNSIYIVGDDSPWLFKLNDSFNIVEHYRLSAIDSIVGGRVPGSVKADFECMEKLNDSMLLVISSGSYIHKRDTAYLFDIRNNEITHKKNIRDLFEKIKQSAMLPDENEINVEGLAIGPDKVYLLHRGNVSENFIIEIDKTSWHDYFTSAGPLPSISIYKFNLPHYDNVPSGFSGACYHNDGIIFTASMEDTSSEISDGEILGSIVGYIPLSEIRTGKNITTLLKSKNKILSKKLEGVSVHNINNKSQLITVVDNDDGTSDLIIMEISFK